VDEERPIVAVVDDDPRVCESLEDLLESAGYCVNAFDAAEAFLASDHSHSDCLITDIGLPGMDGFELHEIVKRSKPRLPVFLITGRHNSSDQQRAAAQNVRGFFSKPFDAQRLLSEIGQALREIDGE
jgi:FixJ family two-component response regulator